MFTALVVAAMTLGTTGFPTSGNNARYPDLNLAVKISVTKGLLQAPVDGRVVLMFAPNGTNPLDDTDVTSSPNMIYGKNIYRWGGGNPIIFSGGGNQSTDDGVYGWPNISLNDVPPGIYQVQAFFTKYETVTRSDGSRVSVHFPCGDGAPNVDSFGSLVTAATNFKVSGGPQILELEFSNVTAIDSFKESEIGSCNQGNYEDTPTSNT